MYEYHGWFQIHESAYEDDFERLDEIASWLRERITADEYVPPGVVVQGLGGTYYLLLHGQHNHDSGATDAIRRLLTALGDRAPGTHGQLYVGDDEAGDAWNEYRVIVMVRGRLRDEKDPWFSPLVPTVEDPEPSDGAGQT